MGKIAQTVTKGNIKVGPRTVKYLKAAFGYSWVIFSPEDKPEYYTENKDRAIHLARQFNYGDAEHLAAKKKLPVKVAAAFLGAYDEEEEEHEQ